MKRTAVAVAALLSAVLLTITGAPAFAGIFGTTDAPSPDDARVITVAGTYDDAQATANRDAYLEAVSYGNEQASNAIANLNLWKTDTAALTAQLRERDVKYATDMNARLATITSLRAKVQKKNAKIAGLRAIIRDLRSR